MVGEALLASKAIPTSEPRHAGRTTSGKMKAVSQPPIVTSREGRPAPFTEAQLERRRKSQARVLWVGAAAFQGYFTAFFLLGEYNAASLLVGTTMALGLAVAGKALHDGLGENAVSLVVAVMLGVGAVTSALVSHGSHCMGFQAIWAMPLVFSMFFRNAWRGTLTVGLLAMGGGVFILAQEGETAARMLQWATMASAAVGFAAVLGELTRRELMRLIADTEEAHTRLAVADRMASIGMLASGVAHEINNPLMFISNNLEFVSNELKMVEHPLQDSLGDALTDVRLGCDRLGTIASTLLRLSRNQGSSGNVDLDRVLDDLLRLGRLHLQRQARVTFEPGSNLQVAGDGTRLSQVFMNLLVNAAQAVEQRQDGPRTIHIRTYKRAMDQAVVEIRDAGCGISQKDLNHIFEPFFTTKRMGQGTGLGLALSARIVEDHGGVIEVESTQGLGSVFSVVLPLPAAVPLSAHG